MWRFVLLLMALSAPARGDPVAQLQAAEAQLLAVDSSYTKRRALGQAIRAYEAAMTEVATGSDALGQKIRAQDRALAQAAPELRQRLSLLIRMARAAEPIVLLGEGDPADTLRGIMLVRRLSADAQAHVAAVAQDRAALDALRAQHTDLLARLESGRQRLAGIRATLISKTQDENPVTAPPPDIGDAAQDLAAMALALTQSLPENTAALPNIDRPMPLPVQGVVRHKADAADATGVARPGVTVQATAGAVLLSPAQATVRFVGPLDGYGQVVILEPAERFSLILAGVGETLVQPTQIVETGEILGFLPGGLIDPETTNTEFLRPSGNGSGQHRVKSLYIELRQGQRPIDPTGWFKYDR